MTVIQFYLPSKKLMREPKQTTVLLLMDKFPISHVAGCN